MRDYVVSNFVGSPHPKFQFRAREYTVYTQHLLRLHSGETPCRGAFYNTAASRDAVDIKLPTTVAGDITIRQFRLYSSTMATPEQWLKIWDDGLTFHHFIKDHTDTRHHYGTDPDKSTAHVHVHGAEVDRHLQRNLHSLTQGRDNLSILVTLCGNSPDLVWLCEKGYEVVGCELSAKAVEQLFENKVLGKKIAHEVKDEGGIKTFTATDGKNLKVYVGDFFGPLSPDLTGTFDCIWGIISIPADLRVQYAEKVSKFLKPGGRMLFSTLDCDADPKDKSPPPISPSYLSELFPHFTVEVLETPESPWHTKMFGGGNWTNPVSLLTPKAST